MKLLAFKRVIFSLTLVCLASCLCFLAGQRSVSPASWMAMNMNGLPVLAKIMVWSSNFGLDRWALSTRFGRRSKMLTLVKRICLAFSFF